MISRIPSSHRIAVISDLHSNAEAFAAALRLADREGFDRLALLGDLFSYGCHPARVLSMVHDLAHRKNLLLLTGNHDQIYLRMQQGQPCGVSRLPCWLQESIGWTLEQLGNDSSVSELPWQRQVSLERILLAHANPFVFGDWTYLEGPDQLRRAGRIVHGDGARVGLFGHTHRSMAARVGDDGSVHSVDGAHWQVRLEAFDETLLANPGSVGQPRCANRISTMLLLTVTDRQVDGQRLHVPYDVRAHTRAIWNSSLTAGTKNRLMNYFENKRQEET